MSTPPPARDARTRKADTLQMLTTPAIDVWVATSSTSGEAHLVPLSLCWTGDRVVIATDPASVTVVNLRATGRARLGVGPTRDVVMLDAELERVVDVTEDDDLHTAYVGQADWDPRRMGGAVYAVLRPVRIQAWRESNEIPGRTLMQDGTWRV